MGKHTVLLEKLRTMVAPVSQVSCRAEEDGLERATCSAAVPPPAALVATSETGSAACSFPAQCTSASTALMATTEYGSTPCFCSVGTAETGSAAGSFPAECTSSSTALMATGESDSTHLLRVSSICENPPSCASTGRVLGLASLIKSYVQAICCKCAEVNALVFFLTKYDLAFSSLEAVWRSFCNHTKTRLCYQWNTTHKTRHSAINKT